MAGNNINLNLSLKDNASAKLIDLQHYFFRVNFAIWLEQRVWNEQLKIKLDIAQFIFNQDEK